MQSIILTLYRTIASILITVPAIFNFENNNGVVGSLLYIPTWMVLLTLLFIYIDEKIVPMLIRFKEWRLKVEIKNIGLAPHAYKP